MIGVLDFVAGDHRERQRLYLLRHGVGNVVRRLSFRELAFITSIKAFFELVHVRTVQGGARGCYHLEL